MMFMVSAEKLGNPRVIANTGRIIGFDMSAMMEEVYEEAIIDIVKPETLISYPVIIKVRWSPKILPLQPNQLCTCRTYTSQTYNCVNSTSNHLSPSCARRRNARKSTRSCYTSTRSSLHSECRSRHRPKSRSRTRPRLSSQRFGPLEGDFSRGDGRVKEGARRLARRG